MIIGLIMMLTTAATMMTVALVVERTGVEAFPIFSIY
jgi:hypothetical protein